MVAENPWVSLLGAVITVAVVIGLAYWFTRYIVGGKHMGSLGLLQRNEQLRVLAQTQVGRDQRLAVVQAGTRYFLLGMTPQNISLLAELTEEEAACWLKERESTQTEQKTPFQQAFQKAINKEKKR